ncbi:MAG TPA: GNAT family N-acetyltransferase [Acidimicrobiales bacterium]|nr:GNAT family N-acetyltransferase [Acidimicrobiales bacterium]
MTHGGDGDHGARSEITLLVVGLDDSRARSLEAKHIEEMTRLYGGRGPGPLTVEGFVSPDGCFVVALLDGVPVGCGGFHRLAPDVAEIKRMFVDGPVRSRGLARRILHFLEQRAGEAGYTETWLETGSAQPEAIALYTSSGYQPMAPYGEFKGDERCRCFRRPLGDDGSSTGASR